ncbi:MAG: hypothetical protein J0I21_03945, partial [Alphaproteobacteria bacterium]|nr:hypothetical protein [Alphaproteobacteria bacterium]
MTRTYARIENGIVAELLTSAETPQTLFHPALHWMDVTGQGVAVGWRQNPVTGSASDQDRIAVLVGHHRAGVGGQHRGRRRDGGQLLHRQQY